MLRMELRVWLAPLLSHVSAHLPRSPCTCTVTVQASWSPAASGSVVAVIMTSRIFLRPRLLIRVVRPLTVDMVNLSTLNAAHSRHGLGEVSLHGAPASLSVTRAVLGTRSATHYSLMIPGEGH